MGPSDVGKSSILRALAWCCFNKPNGQAFIRDGSDESRVQIRVEGKTIERRRGSDNLYLVDGSEYKSFGSDPPEPVSNLINLDSINFQWQHDSLFWFQLSPGQVAKELNRIVNLSKMDQAVKHLSGKVRQSDTELKLVSRNLDQAKETESSLTWTKEADEDLGKIESLQSRIDEKGSRIVSIKRFLKEAKEAEGRRDRALQAVSGACGVLSQAESVMDRGKQVNPLATLLSQVRSYQEILASSDRELKTLKRRMPTLCPICQSPLKS